jgi:hypothetical protein
VVASALTVGTGLGRSVVMSGSSEGIPRVGEWPDRVAGVLAEGGGKVDRPGAAERADDQVAQAGHDVGSGAGVGLRASSQKVTSRRCAASRLPSARPAGR